MTRWANAVAKIVRAELVVVDDVGLLPVGADTAEGLYRIVEAAYERKSVAISSKLHPSGFDELMPKTLATATVDRLLHHAHLCQTSGDSVRPAQALHGRSQTPDLTPHQRPVADTLTGRFMSANGPLQMSIDTSGGAAVVTGTVGGRRDHRPTAIATVGRRSYRGTPDRGSHRGVRGLVSGSTRSQQ
jgi:IstB-like ATP binding protein